MAHPPPPARVPPGADGPDPAPQRLVRRPGGLSRPGTGPKPGRDSTPGQDSRAPGTTTMWWFPGLCHAGVRPLTIPAVPVRAAGMVSVRRAVRCCGSGTGG
ncbi:hypothetical protein ACFFX0_26565 [Citricoccus parietis]|uniref:Uncharacterized protein n=1 Tax=Citricoccus parietis TaxID=592307 RepID=A0ABV5G6I1_9MICC